jgi:hypothetical protein
MPAFFIKIEDVFPGIFVRFKKQFSRFAIQLWQPGTLAFIALAKGLKADSVNCCAKTILKLGASFPYFL